MASGRRNAHCANRAAAGKLEHGAMIFALAGKGLTQGDVMLLRILGLKCYTCGIVVDRPQNPRREIQAHVGHEFYVSHIRTIAPERLIDRLMNE